MSVLPSKPPQYAIEIWSPMPDSAFCWELIGGQANTKTFTSKHEARDYMYEWETERGIQHGKLRVVELVRL